MLFSALCHELIGAPRNLIKGELIVLPTRAELLGGIEYSPLKRRGLGCKNGSCCQNVVSQFLIVTLFEGLVFLSEMVA